MFKRGFQIYIKDVRKNILNKISVLIVLALVIVVILFRLMVTNVFLCEFSTEFIISVVSRLLMIIFAVRCFGSDYFTNTARLIYSVQESRLVIYVFKIFFNITYGLYLAVLYIAFKLCASWNIGGITSIREILTIFEVYLFFSTAVVVFSIFLSLIMKSVAMIIFIDYFLFLGPGGNYLVIWGKDVSNAFLRTILSHNTFYELNQSFSVMKLDLVALESLMFFLLFFGIIGAVMHMRKDIR